MVEVDLARRRKKMNPQMKRAMSTTGTAVAMAIVVVLRGPGGEGSPVSLGGGESVSPGFATSVPPSVPLVGEAPGLSGKDRSPSCQMMAMTGDQTFVNPVVIPPGPARETVEVKIWVQLEVASDPSEKPLSRRGCQQDQRKVSNTYPGQHFDPISAGRSDQSVIVLASVYDDGQNKPGE